MSASQAGIRFGADGWHARLDDGYTRDNVCRIADALGKIWSRDAPGGVAYVGYDLRPESRAMAREVAWTLAGHGLAARLCSTHCPTPAVGVACARDERAVGGVILTGSRRSAEYGGLLVRGPQGGSRPSEFYERLEGAIGASPSGARASYDEVDLRDAYLKDLLASVDAQAIARAHLRVVADPMYGAGVGWLASALEAAGVEVVPLHAEPTPGFGGLHPEPTSPWSDDCERAVLDAGADLGIMLDGDGDRAGVVDDRGRTLPPMDLVPLVLRHLVEAHGRHGRVVTSTTCSGAIARMAERLGCESTCVPVGFSRLYREMREGDVLLAAEEYGGMAVPEHLRERDGLLVALLVCEALALSGTTLSELVARMRAELGPFRYGRRDVRIGAASTQAIRNILPGLCPGELAGERPVEVSHADGLRLDFADGSWVLVRPARTESVVRVYAEAPTEVKRDALLDAAVSLVREA